MAHEKTNWRLVSQARRKLNMTLADLAQAVGLRSAGDLMNRLSGSAKHARRCPFWLAARVEDVLGLQGQLRVYPPQNMAFHRDGDTWRSMNGKVTLDIKTGGEHDASGQ